MKDLDSLIHECDLDIRAGRPWKAAARISSLNLAKVPRKWRLPLAQICRRAGLYANGLRLLSTVNLSQNGTLEATPAEAAEYAVLLLRSGAQFEALERLKKISPEDVPEVLLYRAYAHFSVWEYKIALPLIHQYLECALSDYAQLVARTNLAFAYAETRSYPEALKLLDENIRQTEILGLRQLQSTCHTLRAQTHIQNQEFSLARVELETVKGLTDGANTNDGFLTVKWGLILQGLESKKLEPFDQLRDLAIVNHSWESWREADFYSLLVKENRERFVHLYFGTPFAEFREMMVRDFGSPPKQQTYVLGRKSSPRFDLRTGLIDGREGLALGGNLHRLFERLLSDLYQPPRLAGLFSDLFRGEYYNIASSPARVHQLLWRTRQWLKDEEIPVVIDETDGFYSLCITGDFSFRVPIERFSLTSSDQKLNQLRIAIGESVIFTARDVQEKMAISKTSAHELLKRGLSQGQITRNGTKRIPTYMFMASQALKVS